MQWLISHHRWHHTDNLSVRFPSLCLFPGRMQSESQRQPEHPGTYQVRIFNRWSISSLILSKTLTLLQYKQEQSTLTASRNAGMVEKGNRRLPSLLASTKASLSPRVGDVPDESDVLKREAYGFFPGDAPESYKPWCSLVARTTDEFHLLSLRLPSPWG